MWNTIMGLAAPWVIEYLLWPILAAWIGGVVTWIGVQYKRWTGRELERSLREGLHSALESAARLIIERYGESNIDHDPAAAHDALEYVRRSAPEAIEHFSLDGSRLLDMIRSKLPLFGA